MSEPTGLCQCGCSRPTSIAKVNDASHGYIKGQPMRFIRGHSSRGSNHHAWKGDAGSYHTIHAWLRANCPKNGVCEKCGEPKPTEYALIHGREYSRNRNDYLELCKLCHNRYDEVGGSRWRGVLTGAARLGDPPDCKCGCDSKVTLRPNGAGWRKYVEGHLEAQRDKRRSELPRSTRPSRPPGPLPARACAHCGRQFVPRRSDMIFHSKACKSAHRRAEAKDNEERMCHQCGRMFPCNRFDQVRHCSRSCGAICGHAGGCPAAPRP